MAARHPSSFKRCVFHKDIEEAPIADILVAAVATRPTPLCYLHLLHGGGAIRDVAEDAAAFGCRDWDSACVFTGVWPRNQDGTEASRAAVGWVYRVVSELLPLTNSGVYGADLGPDPRDALLAVRAFGSNGMRLSRLKQSLDPRNVLAHACPLPCPPRDPKLIVLVTGDHGAGKDYCADVWVSVLTKQDLSARAISISEATKHEYAAANGANLERLLRDRDYNEAHRPALTAFFQSQVQRRPRLPEEHFLHRVRNAADADVLLITGMRDEAPVPSLAHLVPQSGLLEVRVEASQETRWMRRRKFDTRRVTAAATKMSGAIAPVSFSTMTPTDPRRYRTLPSATSSPSFTRTASACHAWCAASPTFHARASSSATSSTLPSGRAGWPYVRPCSEAISQATGPKSTL